MPSEPTTRRSLGLFLKGFVSTVLGTLVWQLCVWVAVVVVASSHWLAMHTRHRTELAIGGWLIGLGLNASGIYWAHRRARARTRAGIQAGFWLLLFLGVLFVWLATVLRHIAEGLRD